jgi:YidC/Oxa1 family membrane protein insertase
MENKNNGLDRNQIIGFVLIAVIMVGFGWWQSKNIPEVQPVSTAQEEGINSAINVTDSRAELSSIALNEAKPVVRDSSMFLAEEVMLSNDVLQMTFSTKGAAMVKADLLDYHNYDDTAHTAPLNIIDGNQIFDISIPGDKGLSAKEFSITSQSSRSLTLFDGKTKVEIELPESGYDFTYVVSGNATSSGKPELYWERAAQRTEKGIKTERQYSTFTYRETIDGDTEHLSGRGGDKDKSIEGMDWLAQKQRFFSIIVHPETGFASGQLTTVNGLDEDNDLIKDYSATAVIDQTVSGAYTLPFKMYVGPNQYQLLKSYDQGYEKSINFGWGIFGWIGRAVVVKVFNWLEGYGWNYGLIILVMVLIIKTVLFPLTFASYRSMAKMRVLKPQIDEISKKFGDKDQVAKQQATMSLYREAGASPLGGCIPVIVQMPILFAMFRFFPASIELRGQSFLWANDLSTYDSVISWSTEIPLISTFFGNHLSLFTLLMTASTILYTWMNQQMTPQTGSNEQMKQMRTIMYLMPLMFMFVLNSFPSGLTYYYFVSNIVTFAMQWGIRKSVNDEVILAKIDAKRALPKKEKKESKFQKRLEDMQRQQNLNRSQRRTKE